MNRDFEVHPIGTGEKLRQREAEIERLKADAPTTPLREGLEQNATALNAFIYTSPLADEETQAFIAGWNARHTADDFDMALHWWKRAGERRARYLSSATIPTTPPEQSPDRGTNGQ